MKSFRPVSAKVLAGFFAAAMYALPQAYTISAKPGAVNYIEGTVLLDGQPLLASGLKATFLNAGSLLETRDGKAEVLLAPGVFLRVGENSQVRMLKPSLINTEVAIEAGESMLEVDEYIRDSHIVISERGGLVEIQKSGLYRFTADADPSITVIEGKAEVSFGEKHTTLGKGREALLSDALKTRKFDKDSEDELFAWSNIRAQYNASLTYQASRNAYNGSLGSGGSFGSGFYGSGWYWSNGFNSWLWMPGNSAFFSPFGWGFYGPGAAAYAPVVVVPVRGGGGVYGRPGFGHPGRHPGRGDHDGTGRWGAVAGSGNGQRPANAVLPAAGTMTVPVNARQLPAIGSFNGSPAAYAAARAEAHRAIEANGGLRTGSGAPPRSFGGVQGGAGAHPNGGWNGGGGGQQSHSAGSGGGGHWNGGGNGGGGGNSGGGHWNGGGSSSAGGASPRSAGGSGGSSGGGGRPSGK